MRARAARASYALEFQAVAVAPEFEGTAASERPRKHGLSTVGDDTKARFSVTARPAHEERSTLIFRRRLGILAAQGEGL